MTEETMNELKQTEKAYDAAIAAATNETHKAGLEKLKGFISDAIDHELFDRAEGRDCQIKYVSGDSDVGMPCGKPAVASCGDCGFAICSDCQQECCGDSFCGQCYEYHVATSCVRKPAQYERHPYRLPEVPMTKKHDLQTVLVTVRTSESRQEGS